MENTEQVASEPQQEVALVDEEGLSQSTGNLNIPQDESAPSDDEPSPSRWSKNMSFPQVTSFFGEKDKVVNIVTFESGQPQIKEKELLKVLEKVGNLPLVIVSMIGVARSGKSFLLNLYINYLTYLELNGSDENWESSATKTKGFPWGQSRTAVSRGISVWSKPFIVEPEKDKKIAILIMDCEGEGHIKGDARVDHLVTSISLQMASVQLLNVEKILQPMNLTRLELCSAYGGKQVAEDENEDSLFRSLIFVIRNYNHDNVTGEDDRIFDELLEDCQTSDIVDLVNGIKKSFKSITAFNFPYPGHGVDRAKEDTFDWRLADVEQDFLKAIKSLFQRVSHMDSRKGQQHCWANAIQPVHILETIRERYENEDLPPIATPREQLEDALCRKVYMEVSQICQVEMFKFLDPSELKKYSESEELESDLERVAEDYRERFKTEAGYHGLSKSASFSKFQSDFEKNITEVRLVVMSQFIRERLECMKTELKAAEDNTIESLLLQQLQDVRDLIANSKSSFKKANDQTPVNDLKSTLADAKNCSAKKGASKKLTYTEEKLRRREEKQAAEAKILQKHQQSLLEKIALAKTNKEKLIQQLTKKSKSYEKQLKKLEEEQRNRAKFRSGIVKSFLLWSAVAGVGAALAVPIVTSVGAAFATVSTVVGAVGFLIGK